MRGLRREKCKVTIMKCNKKPKWFRCSWFAIWSSWTRTRIIINFMATRLQAEKERELVLQMDRWFGRRHLRNLEYWIALFVVSSHHPPTAPVPYVSLNIYSDISGRKWKQSQNYLGKNEGNEITMLNSDAWDHPWTDMYEKKCVIWDFEESKTMATL